MSKNLDSLIAKWKADKYKKPVRGAIILNTDLTKVSIYIMSVLRAFSHTHTRTHTVSAGSRLPFLDLMGIPQRQEGGGGERRGHSCQRGLRGDRL